MSQVSKLCCSGNGLRNLLSGGGLALWLVVVLLAGDAAFPTPAMAAAPVIQNPVQDTQYDRPFTGPLDVDFTGAPAGTYTLRVSGPSYSWQTVHNFDGETPAFSADFSPITTPGTYSAVVEDSSQAPMASTSFSVVALDSAKIVSPEEGQWFPSPFSDDVSVNWNSIANSNYTYRVDILKGGSLWKSCQYAGGSIEGTTTQCPVVGGTGDYEARVINQSLAAIVDDVEFSVGVGYDEAMINSPKQGEKFLAPFEGRVSVSWSSIADPSDSYAVIIRKNGSHYEQCYYSGTNLMNGTTTHCSFEGGAGSYVAKVFNDDRLELLDSSSFSVVPRLTLTDVKVRAGTFYPLIRDGFRDTTTIRFRTNKTSNNQIKVKKDGRTLKRVQFGSQDGGSHEWSWNGRNRAGQKVKPGNYKIQVISKALGETRKVDRAVSVDTRVVRKYFSESRSGSGYRSRGKRGNCNFQHNAGQVLLTCLYGIAWTDYVLQMSPHGLNHIVGGPIVDSSGFSYHSGLVRCHARKDAVRRGRSLVTRFISNGSNGWSQCWVSSARVRYHYLYRQ